MESLYKDHMTTEMIEVLDVLSEEYMKKEFLFCHQNYLKANNASNTKLPTTAASGLTVVHGARVDMYNIAKYWEQRRDSIGWFLPDRWVRIQLGIIKEDEI
jgi:hypothetical protein